MADLDVTTCFTYPTNFLMNPTSTSSCILGPIPGLADREVESSRLQGAVTMSIHKLSAGSGYDYLTRQVAALDATEKGHIGLASYYTERGESPGAWIGSGMAGIDGLNVGDPVTAEQMRALFGAGMHPLAAERLEQLDDAGPDRREHEGTSPSWGAVQGCTPAMSALSGSRWRGGLPRGRPPGSRQTSQSPRRSGPGAHRGGAGVLPSRAWPRSDRCPRDRRLIAKESRPRTQTVAGYDLTFSPVKSVSTLWAVADPHVAAQIERAHQAAVQDALSFIERHACSPGKAGTGSGRSTSPAWSRPRSPTATPEPAIRTCTLTSPSRTRCKPSTDAG